MIIFWGFLDFQRVLIVGAIFSECIGVFFGEKDKVVVFMWGSAALFFCILGRIFVFLDLREGF